MYARPLLDCLSVPLHVFTCDAVDASSFRPSPKKSSHFNLDGLSSDAGSRLARIRSGSIVCPTVGIMRTDSIFQVLSNLNPPSLNSFSNALSLVAPLTARAVSTQVSNASVLVRSRSLQYASSLSIYRRPHHRPSRMQPGMSSAHSILGSSSPPHHLNPSIVLNPLRALSTLSSVPGNLGHPPSCFPGHTPPPQPDHSLSLVHGARSRYGVDLGGPVSLLKSWRRYGYSRSTWRRTRRTCRSRSPFGRRFSLRPIRMDIARLLGNGRGSRNL